MPSRSKSSNDYESRYFDALHDRLDKQDRATSEQNSKLEKILAQTQKTNGRVTKLEAEVDDIKGVVYDVPAKKDLPSVIRDPKFLQMMLYLSLAVLLVVGYVTKIDIGDLIK